MRDAAVTDVWRRFRDREYPTRIDDAHFFDLRGVGEVHVTFKGGITAFCGGNGVGKTTILRALRDALWSDVAIVTDGSGSTPRAELQMVVGNRRRLQAVALASGDGRSSDPDVGFFDGGDLSVRLRRHFESQPSISELLESVEPHEATRDELADASYIIGRDYEALRTYEVDIGEADEVPYFVAQWAGREYGTESMGQGELTALALLWVLRRTRASSILLLEEPDTFLTPRSQLAMFNVLARYSTQKAIWMALTTHSERILRRIPIQNVRLLFRSGGDRTQVCAPDAATQYLLQLGVAPQKRAVVLVEDEMARELALGWIAYFSPQLLHELDLIAVANGESEIRRALAFPKISSGFKIVGLFDGDQREFTEQTVWPYSFLPGNVSPEALMRSVIASRRVDFATRIGRSEHSVALALGAAEGLDAHDWIYTLTRHVSVPISSVVSAFFAVWLSDPATLDAAEKEFRTLEGLLA